MAFFYPILRTLLYTSKREIKKVQAFIKLNYQEMYAKWAEYSDRGFFYS